ncbi:hypothetical protein MLD38_020483 [Melastoma candidum]|uniref:Uncharacterized protein n=1 Tax=Melastoma candidum TaxID=119954 RepID=A0ACB9QDK7_9MYRT|nr:hypothetical protein MLD38_020483 [Melastoma candidum]
MGSGRRAASSSSAPSAGVSISGLQQRHQNDIENLTFTAQPFKTLKYFVLAMMQYLQLSVGYIFTIGGFLSLLVAAAAVAAGIMLLTHDGPHGKHVEELSQYVQFGLWWIALGVASSIGLGSGLHTFVLYLGPHIAFFTIKAMQCGRVDLKSAPYDTIQLKRTPSWLDKDCSEFGPPLFSSNHGLRVPLSSILPEVQVEAVLWGIGTALGELPPYFIARAARISGSSAMDEFDVSPSEESGVVSRKLTQIKCWLLSHSQYLNFFTVLILASVPNPLFDLAGIMCGQFGIPFWKFFVATLFGKAIIKTHIQTVFIITVCNNQLLNWIENELIRMLSSVPVVASILPGLVIKLNALRDRYMTAPPPKPSDAKVKKWNLSFASIWNSVVWLMLVNFFIKIVTATAQRYLKRQQEKELDDLTKTLNSSRNSRLPLGSLYGSRKRKGHKNSRV